MYVRAVYESECGVRVQDASFRVSHVLRSLFAKQIVAVPGSTNQNSLHQLNKENKRHQKVAETRMARKRLSVYARVANAYKSNSDISKSVDSNSIRIYLSYIAPGEGCP